MSNIYIQEPPTSGKVLLKTTVGDIDIELWARECPKACRNFVQLCLEGYYNGTTFHRLVKGFIVQGGDPNGDGTGGESIYGHPFKDEFHSRLRYSRRGLVGMANSGKDDNASQFFFTFAATPELENKNTLFGKVTGDTVFNMLKLEESIVDYQERPMYAHRIISAEVLTNPYNDIVPRSLPKPVSKTKKSKKEKQGVKNFGLLSFGEEAEGDEQETSIFVKQNAGKAKSLHDATDDPKLSKEPIKVPKTERAPSEEHLSDDCKEFVARSTNKCSDLVKSKLAKATTKLSKRAEIKIESEDNDDDEGDVLMTREQEQSLQRSKEKSKIRDEIESLKRQYQMDKVTKEKQLTQETEKSSKTDDIKGASENHYINDFIQEKQKYTAKTKSNLKGQGREEFTLNLLSKFKSKLGNLKYKSSSDDVEAESKQLDESTVEKEITGDDWLAHTLNFNSNVPVLAKDASTKSDDWYDVYDPRNPLNKRKRGTAEHSKSKSSKSARRNY
ncbi:spliceosome-associated protein CWC27 homolog [Drosophila grimshawi]|uniref:Spliceosome-associated protein CWC27 homolog n=1 Tax=Drosophila grimshawi TaxID=7222 RepID=B4IZA4_DROGR|nr:spliceosome-associated protein CWC27 homolog [Drosophila grimshawi]EDV96659.1 GH15083 [Drosophila grimshawi]